MRQMLHANICYITSRTGGRPLRTGGMEEGVDPILFSAVKSLIIYLLFLVRLFLWPVLVHEWLNAR